MHLEKALHWLQSAATDGVWGTSQMGHHVPSQHYMPVLQDFPLQFHSCNTPNWDGVFFWHQLRCLRVLRQRHSAPNGCLPYCLLLGAHCPKRNISMGH